MKKHLLFGLAMLVGISLAIPPAVAADEPSLHQIYQAAESGRLDEAQTMMHQVLQAHPNSGKAHYVEAELLAKQGRLADARAELARAESLAPGLPFAKPQAVNNLQHLLAAPAPTGASLPLEAPAGHASNFPWGLFLAGLGLIAFIVFAMRLMSRRNSGEFLPATASAASAGSYQPYGAPYYGAGSAPAAPQGGLGSRLMGGLATGAAVGAGVIAGEALARHFMGDGGNSERLLSPGVGNDSAGLGNDPFNDLGGSDFGVSDGASWDDGGAADDWN